ncbi:Acyl-homoserine-lactone synthase [wastewater metagenome]|uniref:acyl-homoserine-lactone synthase n=2 Tax=unclassified sequences TaxID=12908 RepID=A0A5B8RHV4_9ZZZZ|nr:MULTISPECIES: acyl-homoserine-lactone synthase [Arhodomonas]MCS4502877.1 GNAT family N-acetyltransferase [Arhodomonas aquaeolei]QEA06525.1 acyl-homoserine-lactone synthase [uncultured organism]
MQAQILVGRPSEATLPPSVVDGIYRFRHRVFRQRLGWEVTSVRGRERDDYDDLDPVYIACHKHRETVIGTFRLLPTTGPYMLRDVFPELLRGESVPCASDVWELSRFAVEPSDASERVQASCTETTLSLMRACYRYGASNGIREYVMATSVAVERMLRGMGLELTRFGDGSAVRIGRVLSVACRLRIDEALGRALGALPATDAAAAPAGRAVA